MLSAWALGNSCGQAAVGFRWDPFARMKRDYDHLFKLAPAPLCLSLLPDLALCG